MSRQNPIKTLSGPEHRSSEWLSRAYQNTTSNGRTDYILSEHLPLNVRKTVPQRRQAVILDDIRPQITVSGDAGSGASGPKKTVTINMAKGKARLDVDFFWIF